MQTPPATPQYAYAPSMGSTNNMPQVAQDLQSQGRGDDSMLVHMTPGEVGGLQALAQKMGGSLTTNPNTGLPEAGILGSILPMIAGAILTPLTGGAINPLTAGAIVGGGTGIVTGDLGKGLLAGLGAFGGASLGGALAGTGATATTATGLTAEQLAAPTIANAGTAGTAAASAAPISSIAPVAVPGSTAALPGSLLSPSASAFAPITIQTPAMNAGFLSKFGAAASSGLGGTAAKYAPYAAGLGLLTPAMQPPKPMQAPEEDKSTYRGPYTMAPRRVVYPGAERGSRDSSEFNYFPDRVQLTDAFGQPYRPGQQYAEGGPIQGERQYDFKRTAPAPMSSRAPISAMPMSPFARMSGKGGMRQTDTPINSGPYVARQALPQLAQRPAGPVSASTAPGAERVYNFNRPTNVAPLYSAPAMDQYSSMGGLGGIFFKKGGEVPLEDGSFIVDARSVAEIGRGSTAGGFKELEKIGGEPINGPGDGVSDSIPAKIGTGQKARVANGEVKFSPEAVKRLGNGSHQKGVDRLYGMMRNAEKARKKAKRGQNTGGLTALMPKA